MAIPPAALGACGTAASNGGWDDRMFTSSGSIDPGEQPARLKGIKFGEPCYQSGMLHIPEEAFDMADEDAVLNGDFMGPVDSGELNCPTLIEGYDRDWGPVGDEVGYCLGVPLKIGTGYKPDPGEWDNGGTAVITDLELKTTGPHAGQWEYKVSYDPVKPAGSPYAGGAIAFYGMCRYEGTNDWDGPNPSGGQFPVVQLTNGVPVDVTFWMQADCNGQRNPSGTGGPIGGGYFNTVDEPPILVAYRSVGTSAESGADATYYGNVVSLMHAPGAVKFEGGGGSTIGGEIASTLQIEGSSEFSTGGYVTCATGTNGSGAYNVPMTHRVRYGKDYPASQNPDGVDVPFSDYASSYTANTPYIDNAVCPYVVKIVFQVVTWPSNGGTPEIHTATWTYTAYRDGVPYTDGGDLPADMCKLTTTPTGQCIDVLYPDPNKPEPVINCDIDYSDPGNPITVIGEFFGGLGPWVGCMFTPRGWDRTNKIQKSWQSGAAGEMTAAYQQAVPDGISCGEVADIPVFGSTVTLDTCGADFAPPIVKIVLGWLIVLGIVALVARRIFWAVGSR